MTSTQPFNVREHLIPFVTTVFYRGRAQHHQPRRWPVPTGDLNLYTEQDIEAWRSILPQGVLYAFVHRGHGWSRMDILVGREAWSSAARRLRLWQAAAQLPLSFGQSSLNLCEGLYNLMATKPGDSTKRHKFSDQREVDRLVALDLSDLSDLALTYWMADGLWPRLGAKHADEAFMRLRQHFVETNPLIQLRHGPFIGNAGETPPETLDTLLADPSSRSLLPWWITHALEQWLELEPALWKMDPKTFVDVRLIQVALLTRWVAAIERSGWFNLLAPFQNYFSRLEQRLGIETAPITAAKAFKSTDRSVSADLIARSIANVDRVYKDNRHQERRAVRGSWAALVEAAALLGNCVQKRVALHHADREANDNYLINWAAAQSLEPMVVHLQAVARGIEGRLG